ncbi:MAG: response regulator transcription factor [Parvularculaceae bacterium]|nr:response regulator transcription factor [Parvularculaceae bacterium]
MYRVVVADDHAIVRAGTIAILKGLPDVDVVAEVADGLSAIAETKRHSPDLLVLDAAMPHARGIEVFAEVQRWTPDTKVVLLTGFTSAGILADWLEAKVDGVLLKSCDPDEMAQCFQTVLAGGQFVAKAAQDIVSEVSEFQSFTAREREVLSLVAMGHQTVNIAERLNISPKTVEKHRGSLMNKVGASTVAQLIAYALREGLLEEHRQL